MYVRLGEICDFQSGGTPSKNNQKFFGGDIPWITTVALNGSGIDGSDAVNWITEDAIKQSAAKIVPANSIMIGTRVGVGKVAINLVDMSTSQDVVSLIGIDGTRWCKEYLCKCLTGKSQYLNSQARGATIKGIKIDTLANLKIPEIPIEKQYEVSRIIDKTRIIIEQRKQELTNLDELMKARFVEMFGDPITNSKLLPIEKIEERYFLKAGITTKAEDIHDYLKDKYEIPCYGGNGIRGYVENLSYEGCYPIIGRQGALCGNVQYATGKFHATEHAVLVSTLKNDNTMWVYYMLKLMDLYRYHTGAAQPGLAVKKLNTIDVIVADINLQNQFAAFVHQINKSKFEVQKSLEKTQLLYDSLMQEYFG